MFKSLPGRCLVRSCAAVIFACLAAACSSTSASSESPEKNAPGQTPASSPFSATSVAATMDKSSDAAGLPVQAGGCWSPAEMLAPGQRPERGFEILQRREDGTMTVWLSPAITRREFDALDLPAGWVKNQPRAGGAPGDARFCGSPGDPNGEMRFAELFGHRWAHVATVLEVGVPVDDEGLLFASRVTKRHVITIPTGSTLPILVSPQGDPYPLLSRDAGRTTDDSPLPEGWTLVNHTFDETFTMVLPDPTLNIRTANQDSYQGPVPELRAHIDE